MRVAIPTFGTDISPRFCFAREIIVVELTGEAELWRSRVPLGDMSWPERLAILTTHRVEVLLCGGFPREHHAAIEAARIRVVVGLAGTVDDILDAFRRDKLAERFVSQGSFDALGHACIAGGKHHG